MGFTDDEIKIFNKNYGLGNDILYNLCNDMPLGKIINSNGKIFSKYNNEYSAKEALAAQMWLIGRSYAASPERRYYKIENNKNNDEKLKLSSSGDGLDTYFDLLSNELLEKINVLKKLNEKKYNYDNNFEKDADILIASVEAVLGLNKLLKDIRYAIDEEDIKTYLGKNMFVYDNYKDCQTNALSFCSKFLHFHYPNTVFIMDNITKDHFKGRGKELKFKFNNKDDITESCITVVKQEVRSILIDTFQFDKNYKETDVEKDKEALYKKHCVREYLLTKAIYNKDKTIFNKKYVPRIIDTYMLMANTK